MNINFAPTPQQNGGIVDPNEILRREELARALQQRSSGIQDIESPWQGLAQMSDAVFGGIAGQRAASERSGNNKFLAEALGGAMQGDVSPEKLNQIMALDPDLGMQLYEQQQGRAKEAEAKAQEAAQKQQVSAALREMGATREADAFDAGIIPAAKAYELLIAGQTHEAPTVVESYDPATGQPTKKQWNEKTGQWEDFGGTKAPSGGMQITTNPDGTTSIHMGGTGKALTEGQSKDVGFATRAEGSLATLDSMDAALTSLAGNVAGKVPYGTFLQSEEYQMADQAGREFLASLLRKDSGATITPDEMSNYGAIYLPQPGNPPKVLEQKKQARKRAVEAIKAGMPANAILYMESALAASAPPQPPSAEQPATSGEIVEGTVIENDNGEQLVLKNGQWVPANG